MCGAFGDRIVVHKAPGIASLRTLAGADDFFGKGKKMKRVMVVCGVLFCLLAGLGMAAEGGQQDEMQPGEWALDFGLDGQLFPSAIIILSTVKPDKIGIERDEDTFGSPIGMASVFMRGKKPGDKVAVEISSTKLILPSRLEVTLPDPQKTYDLRPQLRYEYEKLLAVRQPYPEDVTAKVFLNGELLGEKTQTVLVRPINDCLFGMSSGNDEEEDEDWSEMFAAYVNESHPLVDEILAEALRKEYVGQFIGYQGDEDDVKAQLEAIWRVLKERGLKYSDITTTAAQSDTVHAQHVRLVGEALSGAQANCADGSVLLASLLRKIGLNTFLVVLPHHMMVGVTLDEGGEEPVFIETTMLADSSLVEAVNSAIETVEESREKKEEVILINIQEAREAGIMPLRDLRSEK